MKRILFLIILISSLGSLYSQNMEFSSNGVIIPGDGTNVPDISDNTDFGDVNVGGILTHNFTITNVDTGNPGSQIRNITVNSSSFIITNNIVVLKPGYSGTFEISYQPILGGFDVAVVTIEVKKKNDIVHYTFNIKGNGTIELMISQYYENNNSDKIEIKNMLGNFISDGAYYLAIYNFGSGNSGAPDFYTSLGNFNVGEVKLFENNDFLKGNEIIIISTSIGTDCYNNRIDIIGNNTTNWGVNKSFSKGGCASEESHRDFDINYWVEIDIPKVDAADIKQNIAIGTYTAGPISWDGTSWSDSGLPDLSRVAVVNGPYSASTGNIEACDLEINSSLNFDNGTTNSVVLHRNLNVIGTFTIGDTESLVMYDDYASIIGDITKLEKSTYRNNAYDMTYWSTPISNAIISNVFAGVSSNRIYLYDQSQTSASDQSDPTFWNSWMLASGNMLSGKGIAAEGVTGTTGIHDISFTGTPNNGIIYTDVFEWDDNDDNNDFNLIGNPYPSAIDIELFFDKNSSMIDPTIYLWTHNTPISNGNSGDFSFDDYATYNYTGGTSAGSGGQVPEKNIGSSQGFFMRAINSGSVEFNNSMRIENENNQFFKSISNKENITNNNEKDRIWLNLKTNQGGFNQMLVGFLPKATAGIDRGYDALKYNSNNPISVYSIIENQKYSIQGLGSFAIDKTIKIGYDTDVAPRLFTISIEKVEGILKTNDIFLVDSLLNIIHNLKESDYQFEVDKAGENSNRFSLKFVNSTVLSNNNIDLVSGNDFVVSSSNDRLNIRSTKIINSLKVYDILGRTLYNTIPKNKTFNINTESIKPGTVLIIEAYLDNHLRINKKTIAY